jgi:hypothetical protein
MPVPETRHQYLANNHRIERFVFADAAERAAGDNQFWPSGEPYTITAEDISQIAFQEDDETYWRLTGVGPLAWLQITGGGAGGVTLEAILTSDGSPVTVVNVTKIIAPLWSITVSGTEVTIDAIG